MCIRDRISNGHILLEGVPGLAKTLVLKTLAGAIHLQFGRIQFTPDMLPADIVGTLIYNPRDGSFDTKHGPIFSNLVLADEINRAPAKVQSALLEAMQERQVTLGGETLRLPSPFLVLATQNPVEHHGTYPLPESQLDRFLMRVRMGYPEGNAEREILRAEAGVAQLENLRPVLNAADVVEIQQAVAQVHVDESLITYLLNIVTRTRESEYLSLGVSPVSYTHLDVYKRQATCCPQTSSASPSIPPLSRNSNSSADLFSPTCCWPTKSIAPLQRRNRPCSKP